MELGEAPVSRRQIVAAVDESLLGLDGWLVTEVRKAQSDRDGAAAHAYSRVQNEVFRRRMLMLAPVTE